MEKDGVNFFIMGGCISSALTIMITIYVDVDYSYFNQKLELIEQVCERVQSKPDSFDINEVTCTNGKTYKIQ